MFYKSSLFFQSNRFRHGRLNEKPGIVLRSSWPKADIRAGFSLRFNSPRQLDGCAGNSDADRGRLCQRFERNCRSWSQRFHESHKAIQEIYVSQSTRVCVCFFFFFENVIGWRFSLPPADRMGVKGLKIGIPKEYHCDRLSKEVLDTWNEVASLLENAGAVLKEVVYKTKSFNSFLCVTETNNVNWVQNWKPLHWLSQERLI